jgi:hypothetical protein
MSNFRTHISQKQFIPVLLKYENKTKLDAFHPFIQDDLGYFSVHPPASSPSCLITDHKSLDSRKREKPNPSRREANKNRTEAYFEDHIA